MDFSKLTQNNWIAAGGGLVALLSGILPWFSFEQAGLGNLGDLVGVDTSASSAGFNSGLFAQLGILLVIAGAAVLLLKVMDVVDAKVQGLSAEQVAMVLAALGALFILLRVLLKPGDVSAFGVTVESSRAWGGFVGVLAAGATAAGAFLSAKDQGIGIPTADDFTGGSGDSTGGGTSTF